MSDASQHEFDDELLSAYLDDELSAEERALVESRLAADPAARQALEQLRNVSQTVRGLPQEVVGRDLRESILRRAEAAKHGAKSSASVSATAEVDGSNGAPARLGDPIPKLTIGRTTRGWVWASLAVAAALLMMFFQSDGERGAALPEIAQQNSKPADDGEKLARGAAEFRGGNEPVSPDAAPGLSAPSVSEPVARDLAEGLAASAPAPAAESSGVGGEPAVDSLSESVESEVSDESAAAVLGASTAPAQPIEEDEVVVVHVLAKRSALESKAFDQLLASNGIVVDPEDRELETSADLADRKQPQATSGRVAGQIEEQPAADDAEVDMVLVEAPPTTILSCMSDLNQDSSNYLGVSVDDSATTDEVSALAAPFTKKLATDLGKYSRGVVPQRFKDSFARDKASYYGFEANGENAREGRAFGGGVGGASGIKQEARHLLARDSERDRGWARRVTPQGTVSRDGRERSARGEAIAGVEPMSEASKQRAMLRELKTSGDGGRLQVLFVLRPGDESAPSAAASNRAE